MLQVLTVSVIRDLLVLLGHNRDFFQLAREGKSSRLKMALGQSYPSIFADYLLKMSEKEFFHDLKASVGFLKNKSLDADNGFFKAIIKYIAEEFAYLIDDLDDDFFFTDLKKRHEYLAKIFPHQNFLAQNLSELIAFSTYQELNELCYQALAQICDSRLIIVQSPIQIIGVLKKDIRKYFLDKYAYSFVDFRVEKDIIGGVRIVSAGDVDDYSWADKIKKLSLKV
ncbi:MAG: hypothetical protein UR28_C0005G0038 [Candidatus Peregrinibacteria bacterium GW2011_GWF2_33_10]|nr:MAG: hypothetical protein UR28_C0005G0038 [Candidatus Peregrinibacteria bacterium GW2011_GWF2_33_10]OGJ45767.1 MAG: hypothetical protein A2263_01185 [Candidatus Peregrinibacteria bacterium RIFOXYA2_FULL_33_21]OGJ46827.1 MAG: hypothetical protein A2272_00785 [Candidatus Peregrinibacteria bacterium RIFOXYA12_FULL_33_12]OGJ51297.1 MAG: hypothetical protein A2307_00460 [Candidatus Peregrinibacteria bacterium RIFOXYB2_FULL_33_20]